MSSPSVNTHLTPDQHRMLDIYTAQYIQMNDQINQLYRYLDDIRHNINMVMFSNNLNTNNTNMNSNARNSNINSNRRRPREPGNIFYDYSNPINPSIYLENLASYRNQTQNRSRNANSYFLASDMSGLLSSFLNSTVIIRPTNQQIENASRLVSYSEIQNPNSEACPISLERFNPTDQVRQINHCGHIFLPNEFNEWFQTNVRCPVCRYDIRNNNNTQSVRTNANANAAATGVAIGAAIGTAINEATRSEATRSEATRSEVIRSEPIINNENITNVNVLRNPQTNIVDQVSFDISGNAITNDIMNTITNRLFESLFNPLANTNANNDHFVYDPSNNILMYESIIHPNNNNNNNDNNRRPQQ
jgi:hypothetical protein